MANEWGAISRLTRIAGSKPTESLRHVCTLLDDLWSQFQVYFIDLKRGVAVVTEKNAEHAREVAALKSQMAAMQTTLERVANAVNKLPVYGDDE